MNCSRLGVQADCNSSVTAMPLFVLRLISLSLPKAGLEQSLIQWAKVSGPGCLELPPWICMSWPEVQETKWAKLIPERWRTGIKLHCASPQREHEIQENRKTLLLNK